MVWKLLLRTRVGKLLLEEEKAIKEGPMYLGDVAQEPGEESG